MSIYKIEAQHLCKLPSKTIRIWSMYHSIYGIYKGYPPKYSNLKLLQYYKLQAHLLLSNARNIEDTNSWGNKTKFMVMKSLQPLITFHKQKVIIWEKYVQAHIIWLTTLKILDDHVFDFSNNFFLQPLDSWKFYWYWKVPKLFLT